MMGTRSRIDTLRKNQGRPVSGARHWVDHRIRPTLGMRNRAVVVLEREIWSVIRRMPSACVDVEGAESYPTLNRQHHADRHDEPPGELPAARVPVRGAMGARSVHGGGRLSRLIGLTPAISVGGAR